MRSDTLRSLLPGSLVLGACLLAAGCSSHVYMTATGSTPPAFTHVFITTQAIWVNEAANAGPNDGGWQKFPLTTPITIDLVAASNGTLEEIAGHLAISPGTYNSLQLIPVPYSTTASPSASAAGATYNQEVDFVDGGGNSHQVPLQIPNPDQGLFIAGSLKVPFGNAGAALSSATAATGTTDGFGTTGTTDTGLTGTTTSSSNSDVTFAIAFNAATDISLFTYANPATSGSGSSSSSASSSATTSSSASSSSSATASSSAASSATASSSAASSSATSSSSAAVLASNLNYGAVINTHAQAYDLTTVGGISGGVSFTTFTASNTTYTNPSQRLNILITAEQLSSDGSRHTAVLTTPLNTDGSFLLYPLPCSNDTSNPTYYDVVIHGAGIQTMIIKQVEVTRSLSTTASLATSTTETEPTTGLSFGGSSSSSGAGPTIAVATANTSIGTLIPAPASSFTVGATDTALTLPPGTAVGFYQTLPASGEVPYLIETATLDPVSHTFAIPLALSTGAVETASYTQQGTLTTSALTTSGTESQTLTLTSANPQEKAGSYLVGSSATFYAPSSLSATVNGANAPAITDATVPQVTVTPPALTVQSGAATDTVTVNVTVGGGNAYNAGVLLITQGGTLIASTKLDTVLPAGGQVKVTGVPGGPGANFTPQYQLSALLWNSSDPASLNLQSFTNGVDLTSGSVSDVQVTIN